MSESNFGNIQQQALLASQRQMMMEQQTIQLAMQIYSQLSTQDIHRGIEELKTEQEAWETRKLDLTDPGKKPEEIRCNAEQLARASLHYAHAFMHVLTKG